MSISTYAELKTAIGSWLERDDLTAYIPDFIRLAESRLRKKVRVRDLIQRDAITVNAIQIALPTDILEAIELRLLTSPVTALQYVSPHEMTRYRRTGTGKPRYFTIHKEIEFDINPDEAYSGEIIFYEAVNLLEDTETNALLTKHPELYLYGSLIHSAPFLLHDERIATWSGFYEGCEKMANESSRRSMRSGPQISKAYGRGP